MMKTIRVGIIMIGQGLDKYNIIRLLKQRPDLLGSDTDQEKNTASTNDESQTSFPRAPTSKVLM